MSKQANGNGIKQQLAHMRESLFIGAPCVFSTSLYLQGHLKNGKSMISTSIWTGQNETEQRNTLKIKEYQVILNICGLSSFFTNPCAFFTLDHNGYHDIASSVLESQPNVALFSHSHDIFVGMGTDVDSPGSTRVSFSMTRLSCVLFSRFFCF